MTTRAALTMSLLAISCLAGQALGADEVKARAEETTPTQVNSRNEPLLVTLPTLNRLHVTSGGRVIENTFAGISQPPTPTTRLDCPSTSTYTNASFTGGTYTAQGGLADHEIAAVSYTLPESMFPLKITLIEGIFAQLNATQQTTTEWAVWVWSGTPGSPQPAGFPFSQASDPDIGLPHLVMGLGTQGTNIQFSIEPNDPEQIIIPAETTNDADNVQTFSVGYEVVRHNQPSPNPCTTAPASCCNAFPVTDNTVIGCGTGYAQLNQPSQNWLFALNCGGLGCPPNGGWARFSTLQTDQNILGICFKGCRPRGDWVIRATWDPITCPPPDGACCFGTAGCAIMTQAACAGTGSGVWQGPGTTCGTFANGSWSGCAAPTNQAPNADAGADQTVTDTNNSGSETIVVDGSASTDVDGFIANYTWTEGATVLQNGPAFLQADLSVGVHTLTLTVTDDDNATDTDTVVITVNPGQQTCPADLDNDGVFPGGTPDGGVDINDLLFFLAAFEAGSPAGDLDNDGDPAVGTPDGGVDINDLLFFLARFEGGC